MAQSSLKSIPGSDVLTFQTFDNSNPPVDITSRCTYAVTSDNPAVVAISPATSGPSLALPPASIAVTYAPGSSNLKIVTTDSGGDTIPDVNLACLIAALQGVTTVKASNTATVIA
jgi:hypothetical protein